ncbi:glycolate oxidase FAD binding subunit [Gemmobacter caeni]|uniref:Glycolate oxidase FAD binding subunit n=2 Tax=Gemmobacter caeni TaxID=589035 RepID=A0A2T6AT98_9RHOB|nr:glycolate oxidase FAD binding subunit [Gemmobacter caeni]TWI96099.1 glycolate oxidase FAD binding subunit [Gemmobacter caeni]
MKGWGAVCSPTAFGLPPPEDIFEQMNEMRPASEAELCEIIRAASGPLVVRGGGTRGALPAGAVLETGGLNGVTLYEPGALTLVAGAGTPVAELEALLATEGQRLAFEVPDLRGLLGREGTSTLGGVVAENASGPRRVSVGACRDFCLGVRFVDGRGEVIRNGGRVMKNVTGYDLVKLLAGSRGRLGVLTEVALKVLPRPETEATLCLSGLSDAQAVEALSAALGSPYEVTGAAHLPGQGTYLRIEGFEGSVRYRLERLRAVLASYGAGAEVASPWAAIRDVTALAGRPGDLWRLSLRPSEAPGVVARLGAEAVVYDWGGGLVWALMAPGSDVVGRLGAFSGHATCLRGGVAGPEEPPTIATLTNRLRLQFDPRGVFA